MSPGIFVWLVPKARRRDHQDARDCDLIVSWKHNWPECPVDVVELRRELPKLEKPLTTKDTKEHGGRQEIAEIASSEPQDFSPQIHADERRLGKTKAHR
jgi:hypothetical protein